jgi:transposase
LEVVDRLQRHWPNASLEEMCEHLATEVHVVVSPATMCRALRRLKLRRGKRRPAGRRPPRGQSAQAAHGIAEQSMISEETGSDRSRAHSG